MDTNGFWIGNMGTWLIILILFLFMNNGNWFGGFWGNNAAWLLNGMNNNNNHDNTVDILNNNSFRQQQLAMQNAIQNQTNLITQGFCNTNQSIERSILAWQQNTASIIAASTAGVQKILDKLCDQETQRLRTELAEARVIAQNNQQTNELINALRPSSVPARIVSSPYTSIYPPTTTPTTWA